MKNVFYAGVTISAMAGLPALAGPIPATSQDTPQVRSASLDVVLSAPTFQGVVLAAGWQSSGSGVLSLDGRDGFSMDGRVFSRSSLFALQSIEDRGTPYLGEFASAFLPNAGVKSAPGYSEGYLELAPENSGTQIPLPSAALLGGMSIGLIGLRREARTR